MLPPKAKKTHNKNNAHLRTKKSARSDAGNNSASGIKKH